MVTRAAITLLGLGPGSLDDITVQAQMLLMQAAESGETVYFRTTIHPTIPTLQQHIPHLHFASFDWLYEESSDWNNLYQRIAEDVCARAAQHPLIYAVPGHPLIGESSVQLILKLAREHGLSTRVVAGLSFLEPVCTLLQLDPFSVGMQIIDATDLAALDITEIAGKLIPTMPLLIGQVYNRRVASAVKLALSEYYPDEWPVKLVRAASVHHTTQAEGAEETEAVIEMPLYELDRHNYANHLSTLYVPPVDALSPLRLSETLRFITMRLRREPDGCPWDRAQTHQTLTRYVLEEAYEVVEAIEEGDMAHLAEELGDLLLQVYLHAEIGRQTDEFTLGDVLEHINAKLLRRHPHVFGTTQVSNAEQVVQNWEEIKRQEKITTGQTMQKESTLDGVPLVSPALTVANEYDKKATKAGFYYRDVEGIYDKVLEEIQEVRAATTEADRFEELGDLLLATVVLCRHHGVQAEEALRHANRKFRRRFIAMEQISQAEGRTLASYSADELEKLWNQAKEATRE